jgi:hypothetical protein
MSTLVAQTISNGTVSTSSANVIQGSARAWFNYNGVSNTLVGSFNISSITKNAVGVYTMNFTVAMPNLNYAVTGNAWYSGVAGALMAIEAPPSSTTSKVFAVTNPSATATIDVNYITIAVFSS